MKVIGPHLWLVRANYAGNTSITLWITTRVKSAVEAAQNARRYCRSCSGCYPNLCITEIINHGTIDA